VVEDEDEEEDEDEDEEELDGGVLTLVGGGCSVTLNFVST